VGAITNQILFFLENERPNLHENLTRHLVAFSAAETTPPIPETFVPLRYTLEHRDIYAHL